MIPARGNTKQHQKERCGHSMYTLFMYLVAPGVMNIIFRKNNLELLA